MPRRAQPTDLQEEPAHTGPNPLKLLLIRVASVVWLGCVFGVLSAYREYLPDPPEPQARFWVLASIYFLLSTIAFEIERETARDISNRPPLFWDSTLWTLVILVLLLADLAILGYLLFTSWRFMLFVLVLGVVLGCSSVIRMISRAILFGLCMIWLALWKRSRH